MYAKCPLSPGCLSWLEQSDLLLCSHPRWTNWFVPSDICLERGHRYEMHTSSSRSRVIVAPVLSTLIPCQQLRFIYIHSCFPVNGKVSDTGMVCYSSWVDTTTAKLAKVGNLNLNLSSNYKKLQCTGTRI